MSFSRLSFRQAKSSLRSTVAVAGKSRSSSAISTIPKTQLREFNNFSESIARRVIDSALDSIDLNNTVLATKKPTEADEEDQAQLDALTWRSIVDQPVIENIDNIALEQLFPWKTPPFPELSRLCSKPLVFPDDMPIIVEGTPSSSTHIRDGKEIHEYLSGLDLSAFCSPHKSDPFSLITAELGKINTNITAILGVDHPVLDTVAKYFFANDGGKKIRPTMVLLLSHAMNYHVSSQQNLPYVTTGRVALPTSTLEEAQNSLRAGVPALETDATRIPFPPQTVLPLQRRLAEITEMIHTSSLLHDDVIDKADTRRGFPSVNAAFGNKIAILGGDFLLARASISLARLRNVPVLELMSLTIEQLVKGEVMQMKQAFRSNDKAVSALEMYMRKTYYKTGSLIAHAARSAALLGRYPDSVAQIAYGYGFHLGVAFQLVDDVLDYTGTMSELGKPALNDVSQGLATAPVLLAGFSEPHVLSLVERKFSAIGDIEVALEAVRRSGGIALTRELATAHVQAALDYVARLQPSRYRTALAGLAMAVLTRSK